MLTSCPNLLFPFLNKNILQRDFYKITLRLSKFHLNFFVVFVRGEFEDGDVVCTTWTMVMIAVGCVIFLVISILIVCVLCIYSNRRGLKERDFDDHMPVSARQSMGKFFEKTIFKY